MENCMLGLYLKGKCCLDRFRRRLRRALKEERGDTNVISIILIIIAIIAVAAIYKTGMLGIVGDLIEKIREQLGLD